MIGWDDVYKVVVAMVPLYVALGLGYGSVKWWHIIMPEQCDATNSLVYYFTLPLFAFEFIAHVDPFQMNYPFMGADVIAKLIIVLLLALWAKCSSKGSYCWFITSFSLSTLNNSLVVGVPLMKAMYGQMGVDLVLQSAVVQFTIWFTILLLMLEFRRSGTDFSSTTTVGDSSLLSVEPAGKDLEGNQIIVAASTTTRGSFWDLMKVVWLKLAKNPNSYACIVGIIWAFLANRWHFQMPSIMEGSILIMSRAGTGTAMFSMGLFMALQEKVIACGPTLTIYGMFLRFIVGPATMALGAFSVGLRGEVLRISIIQAALPHAISSFVIAKEYELHATVLSTGVIIGTMVSLPVLISLFAVLEFLH